VIIDPTTRNNIYCPISPQGQWFNHRFGPRDYPDVELNFNTVEKIASRYIGLPFLAIFSSKYGDPIEWSYIKDCSDYLENWMRMETYGMGDIDTYFYCARNFTETMIHLDGLNELCGKVHLGADWNHINELVKTLRNFRKPDLTFHAYEHNKHQIPAIVSYADKCGSKLLIKTADTKTEPHGSCIIDQSKTWLYDAIPHTVPSGLTNKQLAEQYANLDPVPLIRNLVGYNSLRIYTKPSKGRNILESPMLTRVTQTADVVSHKIIKARETHIWLAPTGHCFHTSEEYSMFMYMLGREWNVTNTEMKQLEVTGRDEYAKEVLAYAKAFTPDMLAKVKVTLP